MAEEGTERRLAAIMSADVAGYSRLMGKDETGTLAALKALRKDVFAPQVTAHKGRVVKLMGDGALVEFPSIVNAVDCAVAVQRALADESIKLRIGINVGDIIIEGSDIYGDGVNVAARIQEAAEPGGVALSGPAHDQVAGKVEASFTDGGEHELKNIAKPVRVWHWSDGAGAGSAEPLALPDKPSLAVLPFTNMSGDPEQEYFSDGITEDIITELSRFRSLFVIARNSSFVYKGQSVNVGKVGRELGVAYVVEGSVRKAGNRVRISAQLVEAATGNHLWAERYDRELEDIFAVQDEVVQTISSTIGGRVESDGRKRVARMSGESFLAYDHVLRGIAAWLKNTKEDNRNARKHLEQAIELDPLNPQAHRWLSEVLISDWMAHWVEDRVATLMTAYESAKTAITLDESFSEALATLGSIQVCRREYGDAQHNLERAIQLNPNDTQALGLYGYFLVAVGRVDEALTQLELSTRINPFQAEWVDWVKGMAYFTARRYDDAIGILRTIKDPVNEVRGWLAASYAGAGRYDEARATLTVFLRIAEDDMVEFPGHVPDAWKNYWRGIAVQYQDEADFEHLYDALTKSGLED